MSIIANPFRQCAHSQHPQVRALSIVYNVPVVSDAGNVLENRKFFYIFYFENLTLFQFNYGFDSSVNDNLLLNEVRSVYFVFENSNYRGLIYDSNSASQERKMLLVDSFLQKRALQGLQWEQLAKYKPMVISDSSMEGVVEEMYTAKELGIAGTNKDTIRFYYTDKLRGFNFSFSEKLDSVYGMKLFKIRLQQAKTYNAELKMEIPQRETSFEMKELAKFDTSEILRYFRRYRKDFKEIIP